MRFSSSEGLDRSANPMTGAAASECLRELRVIVSCGDSSLKNGLNATSNRTSEGNPSLVKIPAHLFDKSSPASPPPKSLVQNIGATRFPASRAIMILYQHASPAGSNGEDPWFEHRYRSTPRPGSSSSTKKKNSGSTPMRGQSDTSALAARGSRREYRERDDVPLR